MHAEGGRETETQQNAANSDDGPVKRNLTDTVRQITLSEHNTKIVSLDHVFCMNIQISVY